MDFFGIQELGGQKDLTPPWQTVEACLDGAWNLYVCNPPQAFRAVAVGLHSRHFNSLEKVTPLSCGICVCLKHNSARTFIISAHLPHKQRSDCIETWQTFNSELELVLRNRRMHDTVIILHDTNYELGAVEAMTDPNQADERGFLAQDIIHRHGFVSTRPSTYTWSNTRWFAVKDRTLFWCPHPPLILLSDQVHMDTDFLLGSDHRAVSTSFAQTTLNRAQNQTNYTLP